MKAVLVCVSFAFSLNYAVAQEVDLNKKLVWEKCDTYGLPNAYVRRARVPGGWLVAMHAADQVSGYSMTFYPEPNHDWDGTNGGVARKSRSRFSGANGAWMVQEAATSSKPARSNWERDFWKVDIRLKATNLSPPAVQFAVLDEPPMNSFIKRFRQTQSARPAPASNANLTVAWNQGFKNTPGHRVYLLTDSPHIISGNTSSGEKWVVTKAVNMGEKPVVWCELVTVEKGKKVSVVLSDANRIDLFAVSTSPNQ